jgi:hypothetical protein
MQRLEVSGAVRHVYIYMSLGVKWLRAGAGVQFSSTLSECNNGNRNVTISYLKCNIKVCNCLDYLGRASLALLVR